MCVKWFIISIIKKKIINVDAFIRPIGVMLPFDFPPHARPITLLVWVPILWATESSFSPWYKDSSALRDTKFEPFEVWSRKLVSLPAAASVHHASILPQLLQNGFYKYLLLIWIATNPQALTHSVVKLKELQTSLQVKHSLLFYSLSAPFSFFTCYYLLFSHFRPFNDVYNAVALWARGIHGKPI